MGAEVGGMGGLGGDKIEKKTCPKIIPQFFTCFNEM